MIGEALPGASNSSATARNSSALRAALYATLSRHFCPAPPGTRASLDPNHQTYCPACWLLAREEPESTRGKDVPRALALRPPVRTPTDLQPGTRWRFGLTLFGSQAASLFPYLVVATALMGETGVGRPVQNGQRGRALLRRVWALNPYTEMRQLLVAEGSKRVDAPELAVTQGDVEAAAARLAAQVRGQGNRVNVNFLTPTRLVAGEMLTHSPVFITLFERALGRLRQLTHWYADGETLPVDVERLRCVEFFDSVPTGRPWCLILATKGTHQDSGGVAIPPARYASATVTLSEDASFGLDLTTAGHGTWSQAVAIVPWDAAAVTAAAASSFFTYPKTGTFAPGCVSVRP